MKITDRRTDEQRKTHNWAVVAKDKVLSKMLPSGTSRCAWACESLEAAQQHQKTIENRSDMIYVNVVDLNKYRVPRGTEHFSIYVHD